VEENQMEGLGKVEKWKNLERDFTETRVCEKNPFVKMFLERRENSQIMNFKIVDNFV
jgi:phenolic acid decarboxylase